MNPHSETVIIPERRLKPRIQCDRPAMIQGHDAVGKKFEETGRVVNLSRSGLYVVLNREILTGTEVWIRMAMPTGILPLSSSKLAVHGIVVRGMLHSRSIFGIAVNFEKFKFI